MRQKVTDGYSKRLNEALNDGPRPMSVRALAREMGREDSPYKDLRGTSYGGIRQYVQGDVTHPRIELLRALADVLKVRSDWLAYGQGAMTEEEEKARKAKEEASAGPSDGEEEWGLRDFLRVVQENCDPGSDRIAEDPVTRMAVLEAWGRLAKRPLWPQWGEQEGLYGIGTVAVEEPPAIRVPDSVPESDRLHYTLAAVIGRALRAPFHWLPISPGDLSDAELRDHVLRTCQVLHGLAGIESDEPQRRMRLSGDGEEEGGE